MRRLCLILTLLAQSSAFAAPLNGIVYEKDSPQKKELYRWSRSESGLPAELTVRLKFVDLDGKTAAEEIAVTENGALKSYVVDHRQLNENGRLEVVGRKVKFEYTRKGKPEKNEEDFVDNLVVVPTIVDYLTKHWAKLEKGESVPVRLAVLDRKETVGFEFFKVKDKETPERMVLKMKPSSIFIAAIVNPLYFTFDKKTGHLTEVVGRTLPKKKVGDGWQDLDADIIYSY